MTDLPRHSVSISGVVFNGEGKVLVIKRRDNGEWQPPGGVLELGESIEDGLRREIREETGLAVSVGPITGVYKNLPLAVVALVAKCTGPVGLLQTGDETEDIAWFEPSEAMKLVAPTFAIRIADAFRESPGAAQRTHNGATMI